MVWIIWFGSGLFMIIVMHITLMVTVAIVSGKIVIRGGQGILGERIKPRRRGRR